MFYHFFFMRKGRYDEYSEAVGKFITNETSYIDELKGRWKDKKEKYKHEKSILRSQIKFLRKKNIQLQEQIGFRDPVIYFIFILFFFRGPITPFLH